MGSLPLTTVDQVNSVPVPRWDLACACVRGRSHIESEMPNQDWIEVRVTPAGDVVAAAVSDGAGSAAASRTGARTTCELIVACMLEIGLQMRSSPESSQSVRTRVLQELERVHAELESTGRRLSDFHCTLVACVLTDRGGFVCQIGDSIALSTAFAESGDAESVRLDFFPDGHTRVFRPERGEYANETHFVTEPDWREHLRVSALDVARVDALFLMTDGAMDVATVSGKVFRGFLSNLVGKLVTVADAATRDAIVAEWLNDPRTHRLTTDDKTLFVAIRGQHRSLADRPFHTDTAPAPTRVMPLHAVNVPPAGLAAHSPRLRGKQQPFYRRSTASVAAIIVVFAFVLLAASSFLPSGNPPARTASGAPVELMFVPNGSMALVVAHGGIVEIDLRMVAGDQASLVSVTSSAESALIVESGSRSCSQWRRLTPDRPTCVVRLRALDLKPGARYSVRVEYRNPHSGARGVISLPVRLLGGRLD